MRLDTKLLTPAVYFMKNFVADRDIVPSYKHFYFSGDALRAYSGTAGAAYYGLWPKKGFPEPFSLQADAVVKILTSLTEQNIEEVDLSDVKNGKMVVKGGRFKSSIPALVGEELSDFMTPTTKAKGLEVNKDFWDEVEKILFAVCLDETKPALRSLYIAPSGTLVATDGFRISILRGSKFKPPKALLLPEYLLGRLGSRRSLVSMLIPEENRIWFGMEAAQVFGVGLEGEFPAARAATALKETQAASKTSGSWVTMLGSAEELTHIMNRLLYFADAPGFTFKVTVESKSILVQTGGEDGEPTAEEVIPAKVEGKGGEFKTNGVYFRDALKVGTRFWFTPPTLPATPLYFVSEDNKHDHLVRRLA